jgi:hypothetical protein
LSILENSSQCEHLELGIGRRSSTTWSAKGKRKQKMLESELNNRLRKIKNYAGSFARNELKKIEIKIFPFFMVINLDKRESKGTHWIALAIYQNDIFICDSLGGINPSRALPIELIDFLDIIAHTRNLNMTTQLQSIDSELCGKYCVLFIKQMSKNNSFCQFLLLFTADKIRNDSLVSFLC